MVYFGVENRSVEISSVNLRLLNTVCMACLAWSCAGAAAQTPGALRKLGPPPHDYTLRAVTGEPYTLTETRTSVRKQDVGPPKTTVFVNHKMRDSEGRTRDELGRMEDGHFKCISISLVDPVGHFTATLFSNGKLALVTHFPAPGQLTAEEQAKADALKAERDAARKSAPKNPNEEDLPAETIDGISVPGKRLHLVMQGASVTEDTWFSPELKIEMKSETEDPRSGHFSVIVSDLQRAEPPASLFQIPSDYTVQSQD
jgi:hypothetical protein